MNRILAKRQHGQGMTEYIIIVALIAIAAIATYNYFGETVRQQTTAIAQELSGQSGDNARQAAGTAADNASTEASRHRTLGTYTGNNDGGN